MGTVSADRYTRLGVPRVLVAALTLVLALVLVLAMLALASLPSVATSAATLPSGFRDDNVLSGLTYPTAVRFSPDGRVFVAEKAV